MTFDVSEFRSQVNRYGVARDNLFVVTINGPALGAEFPEQDLRFFCRSVQIPGLQAQTLEYQNQGHGHNEKRVTNMSFDDLNVVFMVDSGYRVHQYFHRWMQAVVNYDNRDYGREYNGMLPFEVAYKDRVTGTVTVQAYGWHNKALSYEFKFEKAYPITLGTTDLAWENNDSLLTLPVSFTFTTFIPTKGVGASVPVTPRPTSKTLGGGVSPNAVNGGLNSVDNSVLDFLNFGGQIQDAVNNFTSISNNVRNAANDFGNQLRSIF